MTIWTRDYFITECARLREVWGTISFWSDVERSVLALKGVAFMMVSSLGSRSVCCNKQDCG
jgi:hypothetical protein